ncbi:hypothetical protein [Paenibacillus sp. OAS669]|nr:hypothetical protein [Paenibacillus sp. OAS669]MBE1442542.1 hypothetical protein [Paenibacillus sp. OAS669]
MSSQSAAVSIEEGLIERVLQLDVISGSYKSSVTPRKSTRWSIS